MLRYANSAWALGLGSAQREERALGGLLRRRTGAIFASLCVVGLLAPLWPSRVAASDDDSGITLRKTVDSATVTPVLPLTLKVDKPQAIPGDTLTYAASITNTGAVLSLRGKFIARGHGEAATTVVYYWDELQVCAKPIEEDHEAKTAHGGVGAESANTEASDEAECDNEEGNPHWKALFGFVASQPNYVPLQPPTVTSGMTLTATSLASPGVTYPATGDPILGTQIGAKSIAAWQYQVSIPLTPAQIAVLTDPKLGHHMRNVIHFEVMLAKSHEDHQFTSGDDERTVRASTSSVGMTNPLQAQANAGAATNVVVTITLPSGQTVQFSSSTTPALASLAPGASVNLTTSYTVPVVAAKGPSETDSAYLARLAAINGSTLQATATATGTGASGPVTVLAAPAVTTMEQLPIVGITKSGPGASDAGLTVSYQLALKNSGGVAAGPLTITDALSDGGSGTVSSVPSSLAAAATATATASYAIPASGPPGTLTDTAAVTWKDANANGYGPVSSAFDTQVTVKVRSEIQTVTTSTATGNFFAEPSSAQSFVAKPGDTPAFQQDFPTIDFNPPAGIVPHNISGVGPLTRPFTDVTTDLNGDFAGTIVAQGSGQQAGLGGLSTFDAVFTANMFVSKAGDVTFNVLTVDGFLLGFGGGATRVSGAYENPPASATTPFKGYPLQGAFNRPGPGSPATYPVTVHFPAAGTYPYELDYFSCCGSQLSLTMTVATFTAQTDPLSVYVGYADGLRAGGSIFPFPWEGSPNVTFIGCPGCQYDAGALRFDNSSNNAITLDAVTVDIAQFHFDLWPHSLTIPAGGILILTQTAQFNFDTSDFSNAGCGGNNGVIPLVNVTQGGKTTSFKDTGQILNTFGFDLACRGNESQSWQRIGGGGTIINVPLPPSDTLTLAPALAQNAIVGQTQIVTVAAMDGTGKAVANLPLTLIVSGPNAQQLTQNTDAKGVATFSYVGFTAGTDSASATAFIFGLRVVSNTTSVTWVIPNGGTAQQAPPSITSPSPADGTVVTKPVPINATFTPPAGQTVASWSVSYQEVGTPATVTLASGTGTPPSPLAIFDPTLLINDTYAITIFATTSGSGGTTQALTTTVAVSGSLKLGRYGVTYQDLSVPVNGFQMDVRRSYDSGDKRVGDFGVGWRVSLANFRVTANRKLGAGGWTEYPTSCILGLCNWGFKTSTPHYVTVTFPDQHQEVFDFTPLGGSGILYFQGSAAFTARTGTTSTLEALDPGLSNGFEGNLYGASGFYNPTRFKLTTHEGRVLVLDTFLGLVSETDRNGNALTVDATGVHASNGQGILFTRDGSGRITQVTGPAAGQTVTYTYSTAGDLATSTDPLGNTNTYAYDSGHNLLKVSGAQGALSTATYDSAGRLTSITDALGHTTNIQNDVGAQTMAYTDATGNSTVVTADDLGDIVREDISAGGQTLTTRFAYDAVGHTILKTDPLGHTVRSEYDAQGNLTRYTDGAGNPTQFSYNGQGQITSVVAPDGATLTSATYDANGNPVTMLGPAGAVLFTYDASGQPLTRTDAAGNVLRYAYDGLGRMSGITDPAGKTTAFQYDAANRLVLVTDALGNSAHFTYDGAGNLIGTSDGRGNSESFTYNAFGSVLSTTDPLGGKATVTYDANGRVTSTIDRAGNSITYAYDANGRLTRVNYPGGEFLAFTMDGFGRPTTATNSSSRIDNSYDAAGNIVSTTTNAPVVGSVTLAYTYDAAGNRLTSTGPDGTTSYAYDSRSRVTRVTDPRGGLFNLQYDSASRITSLSRPNGITDSYSYDVNGRLIAIASKLGGTTIQSLTQTFDSRGQVASRTNAAGPTTFTHDADGRLVGVNAPGAAAQAFVYDAAGNRTSGPLSATSTYNAANELTADAGFTYTYDAEGQRTSKTDRASGATTRYLYNGAQQLTSIQYPDGTTTAYTYDALGRRSTVSAGGTTTAYVYDGLDTRLEYGSAGLAASYVGAGQIDRPLEMTRGATSYYYLQNFQGSVTGLTDASGSIAATYSSDAFGVPTSPQPPVTNPFTYTGREYDAKSGLYYHRARYYEPTTGSFISQDPLRAGHRYSYTGGDPVDFTDPGGAHGFIDFAAIQRFFTTQFLPALRSAGCVLSVVSAAIQLGVDRATSTPVRGDSLFALSANIVSSCALAGLGRLARFKKVGWSLLGFPLIGALFSAVVDIVQQLWCSGGQSVSRKHVIIAGAAGLGTGAGGAVVDTVAAKAAQFVKMLDKAAAAEAGGGASGIVDALSPAGACG